ncbi:MAG: hypothetical protein H6500_03075 [Candidatus Woesearchaeota archaeon]|nr:MAG: hypothetical protein H6500_03075 [Candidatus Woesearchaeota archaeon]
MAAKKKLTQEDINREADLIIKNMDENIDREILDNKKRAKKKEAVNKLYFRYPIFFNLILFLCLLFFSNLGLIDEGSPICFSCIMFTIVLIFSSGVLSTLLLLFSKNDIEIKFIQNLLNCSIIILGLLYLIYEDYINTGGLFLNEISIYLILIILGPIIISSLLRGFYYTIIKLKD